MRQQNANANQSQPKLDVVNPMSMENGSNQTILIRNEQSEAVPAIPMPGPFRGGSICTRVLTILCIVLSIIALMLTGWEWTEKITRKNNATESQRSRF